MISRIASRQHSALRNLSPTNKSPLPYLSPTLRTPAPNKQTFIDTSSRRILIIPLYGHSSRQPPHLHRWRVYDANQVRGRRNNNIIIINSSKYSRDRCTASTDRLRPLHSASSTSIDVALGRELLVRLLGEPLPMSIEVCVVGWLGLWVRVLRLLMCMCVCMRMCMCMCLCVSCCVERSIVYCVASGE